MSAKYGQAIKWTKFGGDVTTFEVSDCDTWEEARDKVVAWAVSEGWTPPRWWQVWRWRDTRPQLEETPPSLPLIRKEKEQ